MSVAYASAGVDTSVEAEASRILYEASKQTHVNRAGKIGAIETMFDDFSGLRVVGLDDIPKGVVMSLGLDGVGTKVVIAQRMKDYETVAFDLFAMLCDDVCVRGGEPALIGSVLDVSTLGTDASKLKHVLELARGYVRAAKEAGVAVMNGELAQLGASISGYGSFPFTWSGACVWFARRESLLDGTKIEVGQHIVALEEAGPRVNGISLLRFVLAKAHGDLWHEKPFGGTTLGEAALRPATIYCRLINKLHGNIARTGPSVITGVAHITGGGVPEKLRRILKRKGYGARLPTLFEPGPFMWHCQEVGQVSDEDAYRTWCMRNGMLVVTTDPALVIKEAHRMRIKAQLVGEVTQNPSITLVSRGYVKTGEWLSFLPHS